LQRSIAIANFGIITGSYIVQQQSYMKGRGAQFNAHNPYLVTQYVQEYFEALDEPMLENSRTEYLLENPRKIINKVPSPDIPMDYSVNPYQGCEHGCTYCYARTTHQYWGMSAGLDFERKIVVKENAAELLREELSKKNWECKPIMLSGNTDCYQPAERKFGITRKMLQVMAEMKQPVGIITKNSLVLRDLDILSEMAKDNLVRVNMSITTLDEELRRVMEPRTSTSTQRLDAVERLTRVGIPVNVMIAPIIPGLTSDEVVPLIKAAAAAGAVSAGFTMVRLNGTIGDIFTDWIRKNLPDRAEKVLHQVAEAHGGKLGDSRFGTRLKGEGNLAESIRRLFRIAHEKYMPAVVVPPMNTSLFKRPRTDGQLSLF
jgi:DNA repair photolyase